METVIAQFGSETAASGDIMSMLGIDWKLLIFQIIGFLLLVFVLSKWIFPIFFKIIDARQEAIEASNRAAVEANKHAEKAQAEIAAMLKQARVEAKDIVATAKDEATSMVTSAETKAKEQSEHLIANAQQEIQKEVVAAKKALHNETIELVASATEKVVGSHVDAGVDAKAIKAALEESK